MFALVGTAAASLAQTFNPEDRATITKQRNTWILQNDALRSVVVFSNGSVEMTSFYNKLADREYLTGSGERHLFQYTFDGTNLVANAGGWSLDASAIKDIKVYGQTWGKQLAVEISRKCPQNVSIKLVFEIYNGSAGLKYSTFIKNNDSAHEKQISASDIIALNFPNEQHTLYYVPQGITWTSTNGSLVAGKENCLARYDTGDGWVISPENNHATSLVPGGFKGDPDNPFLFLDVWNGTPTVKVYSNPKAVQLVLFPKEEVEYFSVNLEVFKGDMWDGRKAAAQHLRQRFKYQNPSRILSVNDWFYSSSGTSRPESYLRSTVVPTLKEMGFDTMQMDALWSTTRDTIIPNAQTFTTNLPAFADWVNSQGLNIGYWISLSGAKWAQGRDLADPATIRLRKKQMEEVVIPLFHVKWQQIDSGQLFKTDIVKPYSHPSDSVYRKFLAFKDYCNYISHKYPDILIRETCEFENLFKGGSASLMAINDNTVAGNFWGSSGGMYGKPLFARDLFSYFGVFPAEGSLGYVGPLQFDGSMGQMYQWLTARDIGIYTDPGLFSPEDIALVRKFTDWMHNPRIKSLLNELACPTSSGGTFDKLMAPYLWMFVNAAKDKALLIGTSTERAPALTGNLRWLDSNKTYLLEDISLYNDGVVRYAFMGKKTGAELKSPGFEVNFAQSRTLAKAFWIQELATAHPHVLYADDKVVSYSEHWDGTSLVVNVKGAANTTGTIVVYKNAVADTEIKHVSIDASGHGTVACDSSTITAPLPPPMEPVVSQSNLALWTTRAGSPYFAPLNPPPVAPTNLALGTVASASNTLNAASAPGKAIDGRLDTSWTSSSGQTNDQWLQIDFGAPVSFDSVKVQEREHCERITSYKIQVWNDAWSDVARGKRVGKTKVDRFPPVVASKVRLYVNTATGSPAIAELAVFKTKEAQHPPK
jgi:hypothetical protein